MGSAVGVKKIVSRRIGCTVEEYERRVAAGEKWCYICREWHAVSAFPIDRTRGDGLQQSCREADLRKRRALYAITGKRPEDPVKVAARQLVIGMRNRGVLPNPKDVACSDCGHIGDDRRHSYDHFLGYNGENARKVQPVCSRCHAEREVVRRRQAPAA